MTIRHLAVAGLAAAVLAIGACGGGHPSTSQPPTSSAPGASIDPNADGTFTGPINQAKRTAAQQSQQGTQLDQQTAGNP